MNLHIVR